MELFVNYNRLEVHLRLLTLLALGCVYAVASRAEAQGYDHVFTIRSYGGKCLDFGPPPQVTGAPVFLYTCNGTVSQQVRIVEPDVTLAGQHRVTLFAGNKVIGLTGNEAAEGAALQLQDQGASPGQVFRLDGDSIMVAANRNLVVQVENNRGANRTRLVTIQRQFSDAEFWVISPIDGSSTSPTTGFVRLPSNASSDTLREALNKASFGSVIVLDDGLDLPLQGPVPLVLKDGVTLRSDRRLNNSGARLTWTAGMLPQPGLDRTMLDARANWTRITGLRLTGPSLTTVEQNTPMWNGILADDSYPSVIDHDELSAWSTAGVGTSYALGVPQSDPQSRSQTIQVIRNFIHHNETENFGYGVVSGDESFPLIGGNTFLLNRHAIAGQNTAGGYFAIHNLVLSSVPGYPRKVTTQREQDFDMHGSSPTSLLETIACGDDKYCGGLAGQYMNVQGNTFLGTHLTLSTHYSFAVRGTPAIGATFQGNIVRQSQGDAIRYLGVPAKLLLINNEFSAPNPTDNLGVGDFDGDGKDDLFLATGAAWYYSSAGKTEWRFLTAHTEKRGELLFGDFDGDGRTDVFKLEGRDWLVSWGGTSTWEKINQSDATLADLAVGDFDGDGRSDIFRSDGTSWFVSSSGIGPLIQYQTSSFRVANLRFGDFNHDSKTDVFGMVSGKWQVSYGAKSSWTVLRPSLMNDISPLVVGDFDGDGKADVALLQNGLVKISSGGTSDWITLNAFTNSLAAVGRFINHNVSSIMVWGQNYLNLLAAGKLPSVRNNPEEMR